MMNIRRILLIILFGLLTACASTAPLPATLNIVPPSSDIPPEIAAFSGIWDGMWNSSIESILVVEKIDTNKAEVILSFGLFPGRAPHYIYRTVEVTDGPVIRWSENDGKTVMTMDKNLNTINGTYTEEKTGAIFRGLFYKRNLE